MTIIVPYIEYLVTITKKDSEQWKQKHAEDIKQGKYKTSPVYKLKEDSPDYVIKRIKEFDDTHYLGVTGRSFIINPEIYDRLKEKDSGNEA